MSKDKKPVGGPLVEAALALESGFAEVEALIAAAQRLPLTSQKNLEKTGAALTELSKVEERLQPLLNALLRALDGLRFSQQGSVEALKARVQEFQERRAAFEAIAARYEAIGRDAERLNKDVQAFTAQSKSAEAGADGAPSVQGIVDELGRLFGIAAEIRTDAQAAEFNELAHEADALRQQLGSARHRLSLIAEKSGASPHRA